MDTTSPPVPASLTGTLVAATVTSVGADRARLALSDTDESITWPLALLPRGIGPGATVYLRALATADVADEADAVARRVLEQFLN